MSKRREGAIAQVSEALTPKQREVFLVLYEIGERLPAAAVARNVSYPPERVEALLRELQQLGMVYATSVMDAGEVDYWQVDRLGGMTTAERAVYYRIRNGQPVDFVTVSLWDEYSAWRDDHTDGHASATAPALLDGLVYKGYLHLWPPATAKGANISRYSTEPPPRYWLRWLLLTLVVTVPVVVLILLF